MACHGRLALHGPASHRAAPLRLLQKHPGEGQAVPRQVVGPGGGLADSLTITRRRRIALSKRLGNASSREVPRALRAGLDRRLGVVACLLDAGRVREELAPDLRHRVIEPEQAPLTEETAGPVRE